MTKLFVKKPYFIIVAIVIVLTIGGVSLTKMQTDLLPQLEMPYMAVITTICVYYIICTYIIFNSSPYSCSSYGFYIT